jgi:hypothetical protein
VSQTYPLFQQGKSNNSGHGNTMTYPLAGQSYDELMNRYVKRNDRQLIIKFSKEQGEVTAKAALKKGDCVGPTGRFITGFLSHPESFWAANFQLAACQGAFGKVQQTHAWQRQQILTAAVFSYIHNMPNGNQHIVAELKKQLSGNFAGFIGRITGSALVTNKVLFGRGQKMMKGLPKTAGYWAGTSAASFLYTFFGQCMLGIAKGLRNLNDLIQFAVTGNIVANHCLNIKEKKENEKSLEISERDKKMINDFFKALYELSKSLDKPPTPSEQFKW